MSLLMRSFVYSIIMFPIIFISPAQTNSVVTGEQQEIIWLIEDTLEWQDYINKISKSTSQDTAAIIMHGLEKLGYQLNIIKSTGERAERILKNESSACMSNRIKNPQREAFSLFSLPHDLYLGLQLYRVTQEYPLSEQVLNSQGEVISLAQLFQHYPKQVLAIPTAVSYGVAIDEQINTLARNNLFIRGGNSRIASLVNMLLKNRVDYIIYYPQDINSINHGNISVESYTIAGSPPYFLGHVACSKTTKGKGIIRDIDNILKQAYQSKAFYDAHEKWLLKGDLAKLRHYYLQVFQHLPE